MKRSFNNFRSISGEMELEKTDDTTLIYIIYRLPPLIRQETDIVLTYDDDINSNARNVRQCTYQYDMPTK